MNISRGDSSLATTKTPQAPAVHIVLDTNALFTKHEDKLVSEELSNFILSDANSLGLRTTWYIPEIVKLERRSQMSARANQLLPNLQKIERLLGHKLNITEDILSLRVDEAIARESGRHKFVELVPDYLKVNWADTVKAAADRSPPFQPGETEKGFKDAIVLEAFCQLAETLPRSPAHARIALLTGDAVLSAALKERARKWNNVYALPDVGALRTMMTAVASHLSDDLVSSIIPKAAAAFLAPAPDGLYYKWKIWSLLIRNGVNVTTATTSGGVSNTLTGIVVSNPSIKEKSAQTLTLVTNVDVQVEQTRYVPRRLMTNPSENALSSAPVNNDIWRVTPLGDINALSAGNALQGLLSPQPPLPPLFDEVKQTVFYGFEVEWTAVLTQTGNLVKAALVEVRDRGE